MPKYILEFDREKTPLWNIENNIFNKDNFLYSEPRFLLQEKINDLSRYFSILHAISSGNTKLSTICSQLEINSSGITPYITKLIDLGILEKEVPVTENIDNGKKGLYRIKDNYLKFWFNYIYPYQSYLEIGNINYPLEKIKTEFDLWVSRTYEELAIVGLGENEIIFGECKWSVKKVGLSVLYALEEKSKKVKWKNSTRKEFFILFSKDLIDYVKTNNNIILSEF